MNAKLVFLPIPEHLKELFSSMGSGETEDDFSIDPDIPIPIQVSGSDCQINIDTVVAGMLRVIETGEANQQWLDYYSSFVFYLRPDIKNKIKELKDNGLDDKKFLKAHRLIREGQVEEGLEEIRDFIERYPLVWNGWLVLGWALSLQGKLEQAETVFEKALELGGQDAKEMLEQYAEKENL